jgi:hypothetical protein
MPFGREAQDRFLRRKTTKSAWRVDAKLFAIVTAVSA